MKNCDEMVSSLLRRRADYEMKKKARRQTVLRMSTVACSLALLVFIGTGTNQGWWVSQKPELPTVTPTLNLLTALPTQPDVQVPTMIPPVQPIQPTVTEPLEENQIIIHEIDGISSNRMYIALMCDDFVPMSDEELNDYFGMDIFPEVPEDLGEEWCVRQDTQKGIYRRDGGTGEVYHDQQVLNWSNEDFSRSVNIELKKGGMPFQCFGVLTEENESAVICGVEVFIGRNDEGIYLVEFMHRDVGFRMIVEGLTQAELVDVIASLIQE